MRTRGLFDIQVNGFAGVDFNNSDLTPDELDHALHAMALQGVTACLPTLITAPEAVLRARLDTLDQAVANSRLGPMMVPGFHLEGPFLSPERGYIGCHPADAVVAPDPDLLDRLIRGLRRPVLMLTLAPERDGALELIRWAVARGIRVAMGHSAATAMTIARAADAGLSLSTHLGNALPQPQAKFDNPLMAQLAEDRLTACVIADGIHVPPSALKVMLRAKEPSRVILVTDATAAAAASVGNHGFAGMTIERSADGSVRLPGTSVLAGSSLCLDQAVRNLIAWRLAPPAMAVAMASDHPARLIGQHGGIPVESSVTWTNRFHPQCVTVGTLRFSSSR